MPRVLSSAALQEKNKLASGAVWHVMMEFTIPGVPTPVRVTSNNESVLWRGETWIAFGFEIGDISEESSGEIPQLRVSISNVSRQMESYLHEFDRYVKVNGYSPVIMMLYVVCDPYQPRSSGVITEVGAEGAVTEIGKGGALTDPLRVIANPDPEAEYVYELVSPESSAQWASLVFGGANIFNWRFPMNRLLAGVCYHRFRDCLCGYMGAGEYCGNTLTGCRALNNSRRFGGAPGLARGVRVA